MVDSYAYAQIPLETFVTDSQYMSHDQDFTLGAQYNVSAFQARQTGQDKGSVLLGCDLVLLGALPGAICSSPDSSCFPRQQHGMSHFSIHAARLPVACMAEHALGAGPGSRLFFLILLLEMT